MQVKLATENTGRKRAGGRGETARTEKTEKTPFLDILKEVLPVQDDDSRELHELWAGLPSAEKDLLEKSSEENLKKYRNLVRRIALDTIKKNVRIKSLKRKSSHSGETIEMKVVDVIDERLQKMALLMHSPGNSAFAMLRAMDEIRGMLLDLRE